MNITKPPLIVISEGLLELEKKENIPALKAFLEKNPEYAELAPEFYDRALYVWRLFVQAGCRLDSLHNIIST